MSTSAISGAALSPLQFLNFNPQAGSVGSAGGDGDGDSDGSRGVGGTAAGSRGQALFGSILQTLGQLGIGPLAQGASGTGQSGSGQSGTSTSSAALTDLAASSTTRQDLHAFMHALFQAVRAAGTGGGTTAAAASTADSDGDNDNSGAQQASAASSVQGSTGTGAYGRLTSGLETLVQDLSSTSGSSPAGLSNLQSAFATLMNDLGSGGTGGGTNPSPTSSATTLQSFLQTLLQNLQGSGSGSLNPLGNNVNKVV